MCIGYDPFKWADNWETEEKYLQDLIKDKEEAKDEEELKKYGFFEF